MENFGISRYYFFVLGEATLHKTIEQRCDLIQKIPQIQIKSKKQTQNQKYNTALVNRVSNRLLQYDPLYMILYFVSPHQRGNLKLVIT